MPARPHGEWYGFTRITLVDGRTKAKCQRCYHEFSNTSSKFLSKHRSNCNPQPCDVPQCNDKNTNTVQARSVCTSNCPTLNVSQTSNENVESLNTRLTSVQQSNDKSLSVVRAMSSSNSTKGSISDKLSQGLNKPECLIKSASSFQDSHTLVRRHQHEMVLPNTQSSNKKKDNIAKKHEEYNSALLVVFASLNLDFSIIRSLPFIKFLSVIDGLYKPPTEDELQTVTLNKAYNDCFGSHHQLDITNLMGTVILEAGLSNWAVSFIIKKDKYFFVDCEEIAVSGDQENEYCMRLVESFLHKSVESIFVNHKVSVHYVILESTMSFNYELVWEKIVDEAVVKFNVKVYRSFKQSIDKLCENIYLRAENEKYAEMCNKLKSKLSDQYYLGEAVNDIFILYEEFKECLNIKEVLEEQMEQILQPLSLTANFFDHRFKGIKFLHSKHYSTSMDLVLWDIIPEDATYALHLYKKCDDPFSRPMFLNAEKKYSVSKYWKLIEVVDVEDSRCNFDSLAKCALPIVVLPSFIRDINEDIIRYIFNSKVHGNEHLTAVIGCSLLN